MFVRQRPTTPFGQGFAFRQLHTKQLIDEWTRAERIRESDEAGGDLQIEKVRWRLAGPAPTQPNFLAAGMDHDKVRRVEREVPEGIDRSDRQRVDQK